MRKFLKFTLILISVSFLCLTVAAVGAYTYLLRFSDLSLDDSVIFYKMRNEKSELYAYDFENRESRDGDIIDTPYAYLSDGGRHEYVSIEKIPQSLIFAFVSIEDKDFFSHAGVDFLRTGRASLQYIIRGKADFGASTITQQLVKNLTGNDEISANRKISEIFSALDMERKYTKDEIMEMYLNIINLGNGCRGVGAGAKYYFSKDLSELNLCECVAIAAITNNPSYYDPQKNPENNARRRNIILSCMREQGYISEEEYLLARDSQLILNISDSEKDEVNSWYTDMVIDDVMRDLCEKYSVSRYVASNLIYSGGLKIYTAVDLEIQNILEEYYENKDNFILCDDKIASSFILIDSRTGDILGVVGNIGEKTQNRLQSFATNTKRPTGSAIKPLSVYAPALDRGIINWSSIYEDSPIKIGDVDWPKNANGRYIGDVDIATAIEKSLNTVPVKILNELGLHKSISFLKEKLGFCSLQYSDGKNTHDECHASLGLGQHEYGATLLELTGAYTVFSCGEYIKPRSYFKVTDREGNILLDNTENRERVISEKSAAIMTKLLEGVVDNGTARNSISLDSRVSVAGKTGTTTNNSDRYFIGYTPTLIGGAWMGYEYPKSIADGGVNPTLKIWDEVMSKIYALSKMENAKSEFDIPDGVKKLSYNADGGGDIDEYTKRENIKNGWFCE